MKKKINKRIFNLKQNLSNSFSYLLIIFLIILNIISSIITSMFYILYFLDNNILKNHNISFLSMLFPLLYLSLIFVCSNKNLKQKYNIELKLVAIITPIFLFFTKFFVNYILKLIYGVTSHTHSTHDLSSFISKMNGYNYTKAYVLSSLLLTLAPLLFNLIFDLFEDNRPETQLYELIDSQKYSKETIFNLELALKLKSMHSAPTQEEQKSFFNELADVKLTKKNIEKIIDLYETLIDKKITDNHSIEYKIFENYPIKLSENPENIIDEYTPKIIISLQKP